jgi:excisionase family DNA binding protein
VDETFDSISSQLLTLPEAAARLRVKVSTLRDWVLNKRIGYVKVGRLVRIPSAEIERFIAARTVPAQSQAQAAA